MNKVWPLLSRGPPGVRAAMLEKTQVFLKLREGEASLNWGAGKECPPTKDL